MNYKFKLLSGVFLLGSLATLPLAKADDVDHLTTVTINAPVEVPGGRVLPAGQYVFKLADNQTDRGVVQIFSADQKQIIATVLAVPAYRSEPTNDTVITLDERSGDSPEAIGKWFFAGQLDGLEFLYQK